MSIGMPVEQFWEGPPRLAKVYREAELIKARRSNTEAWRAGLYFASALNFTVGNMFRKKGTPPVEYMKEPLPLTQQEVEERELRDAMLFEQKLIARMNRLAESGHVAKK